MANMSYCMVENTYKDLVQVIDEIDEDDLSESEEKYLKKLVKLCERFANQFSYYNE